MRKHERTGIPLGDERFLCSQAVALSLQGMPAVYFNSLFGALNNPVVPDDHKRAINRERWEANQLQALLNSPDARESRVFERYLFMLRRRGMHPAFHPDAPQKVLNFGPDLFAVVRCSNDRAETNLCAFNFTRKVKVLPVDSVASILGEFEDNGLRNALAGNQVFVDEDEGGILLQPFEAMWLTH